MLGGVLCCPHPHPTCLSTGQALRLLGSRRWLWVPCACHVIRCGWVGNDLGKLTSWAQDPRQSALGGLAQPPPSSEGHVVGILPTQSPCA